MKKMNLKYQVATVTEAAALLGVTEGRICQLLREESLSGSKHGRAWMIPLEEIERFKRQPRIMRRPRIGD